MILGAGVDIVEISRFSDSLSPHFMSRVFTDGERDFLQKKGKNSYSSMAGLFAAKEAVAKALGTGFLGFWPTDIEILHDRFGKPHVKLHKKAARIAKNLARRKRGFKISLSISHSETCAIASAILEKSR